MADDMLSEETPETIRSRVMLFIVGTAGAAEVFCLTSLEPAFEVSLLGKVEVATLQLVVVVTVSGLLALRQLLST